MTAVGLLGKSGVGTGSVEEITLGEGLELDGAVLSATGGGGGGLGGDIVADSLQLDPAGLLSWGTSASYAALLSIGTTLTVVLANQDDYADLRARDFHAQSLSLTSGATLYAEVKRADLGFGTTSNVILYGSYTDAANYSGMAFLGGNGSAELAGYAAGTGTFPLFNFTGSGIAFWTGSSYATSADRWYIDGSGDFYAGADNAYDIGKSASGRPKDVYIAGTFRSVGNVISDNDIGAGSNRYFYWAGKGAIHMPTTANITLYNSTIDNFGLLQFGGTSDQFPALKRSSTALHVRLADNSYMAPLAAASLSLGDTNISNGTNVLSVVNASSQVTATIRNDGYVYGVGVGTVDNQTAAFDQTSISHTAAAGVRLGNNAAVAWASAVQWWNTPDVLLYRDAPNTLALRNGTAAQTLNVYNTSASSNTIYERARFAWASNKFVIGTEHAGATKRDIAFDANLTFLADNSFDIGASGANRPRYIYVSAALRPTEQTAIYGFSIGADYQGVVVASNLLPGGTQVDATRPSWTLNLQHGTSAAGDAFTINRTAAGLNPNTQYVDLLRITATGLIQFGGTDDNFPALKRSGTELQVRLADDSGFTHIQGKLQTDANAVAETPTATHTLTLYDAAGTAYRVLCVV